jgi:hypothetical protein
MNEVSFDTVVMSSIEFNKITSHPFIASSRFDEVVIDLNDKIDIGYLQPLLKTTKVIPRVVGEITPHAVSLLCELYRDRSAELRFTYIRSKDDFNQLIESMKKQYCWEQFY